MAQIKVTPAELRRQAEELRNQNGQFQSKVEELTGDEQNVAAKWEGEARDAFHKAFNDDKIVWDEFHSVIEQYAMALDNIAAEYERAEAMATQTATQRTY